MQKKIFLILIIIISLANSNYAKNLTPQLPGTYLLSFDIAITGHPYCEYPDLAVDSKGIVWITFMELKDDLESIILYGYKDNVRIDSVMMSSRSGFEYHPRVIVDNRDRVWVVWSARRDGNRDIYTRYFEKGHLSKEIRVTDGSSDEFFPVIANIKKNEILIAYMTDEKGNWDIRAALIKNGKVDDKFIISDDEHNEYRPALISDGRGEAYLAYERQVRGSYKIYLCRISGNRINSSALISPPYGFNLAPSLSFRDDGTVVIAFQTDIEPDGERGITPWICLREIGGKSTSPVYRLASEDDQFKTGEDQGFEFPTILVGNKDRTFLFGRPSQGFFFQVLSGSMKSELYRLEKKGWGGRGQYVRALIHQNALYMVRRDLKYIYFSKMDLKGSIPEPSLPVGTLNYHTPNTEEVSSRKPENFKLSDGSLVFFGDIHQHSSLSDGMGPADLCFTRSRYLLGHDFAALTDHEWFTGNAILPSEWDWIKTAGNIFEQSDSLFVFFAYEWTTPRLPAGFGHKNVYSMDPDFPLIGLSTGYKNSSDLFNAIKKEGAFAVPHHIGWTGTDWENHDEEAQPLVEIVSTHGAFEFMGNEPIPHRGGMPGYFVQDGLALGLRFGLIGSSDGHGLRWHHGVGWKESEWETGLAAAITRERNKKSIFSAFLQKRTYATSGTPILMDFRINGHLMGETISIDTPPEIFAYIRGTSKAKYVRLIRDNKVILYSGKDLDEGKGVRIRYIDSEIEPGEHFYYLRFEQDDGEMAWSSPIFILYNPTDKQK